MSPIPTTSLPHDAYTKVLLLTSKVFFYFVLNTNAEVLGMRRYRDEAFVLVFLGTAQHGTTLPLLWYTFDRSRRGVQMARNGGSIFPRQGGLGLGLMLQAWTNSSLPRQANGAGETRSTIGEGQGCNDFVPVLGGNATKIVPTGDIFDQPPDQMR